MKINLQIGRSECLAEERAICGLVLFGKMLIISSDDLMIEQGMDFH